MKCCTASTKTSVLSVVRIHGDSFCAALVSFLIPSKILHTNSNARGDFVKILYDFLPPDRHHKSQAIQNILTEYRIFCCTLTKSRFAL